MGADASVVLQAGAHAAPVPSMVATAQTGTDTPAARSIEIAAFTGGVALPPQTGTMVTLGSRSLSEMSVPMMGGLPSARPTTSSRLQ
jgi:hypothetical protein